VLKGIIIGLVLAVLLFSSFMWAPAVLPSIGWGSFWAGVVTTVVVEVVSLFTFIILVNSSR